MKQKLIKINNENCVGCRICQLTCSFFYSGEFNPNKSRIIILNIYGLNPKLEFSKDCVKCGKCVSSCLYGALEFIGA